MATQEKEERGGKRRERDRQTNRQREGGKREGVDKK